MNIKVIAVGKIKEDYTISAINEYKKRLNGYVKLEIIEIPDESIDKKSSKSLEQEIKEKEGQKIIGKIGENEYVILFDLNVAQMDSVSFAHHLDKLMTNGKSTICFVIGGSLGLGENIRKRANESIELSKMTFTHQFVRLIVLEQIYRAFKILHNETYHK